MNAEGVGSRDQLQKLATTKQRNQAVINYILFGFRWPGNDWLFRVRIFAASFVCQPGKLEPKSHFPEQFHHPPKINPPTNPNPSYSVSLIELLSAFDALAKLLFKDAILLGAARRRACKHSSGWNGCLSATGSNLLAGVFPGNAAYNCFPRTVQALFHLPTAFIHFVVLQLWTASTTIRTYICCLLVLASVFLQLQVFMFFHLYVVVFFYFLYAFLFFIIPLLRFFFILTWFARCWLWLWLWRGYVGHSLFALLTHLNCTSTIVKTKRKLLPFVWPTTNSIRQHQLLQQQEQ